MFTCAAQVIDATWEPVKVAVPPHRRSVPLTFEQIQTQLPPQSRGPLTAHLASSLAMGEDTTVPLILLPVSMSLSKMAAWSSVWRLTALR
jgi:hypothetical protein